MTEEFKTLPLSNNFMFGEVMRNEALCKLFLEKLLECQIERIEFINKEADIGDSPYNHGIRLDVFLADENNTHYDVEMQNSKDALPQRSRYYQSGIDRRLLEKGAHFDELPESYVIFVCNYDPLGLGKAKYERRSYYKGTDVEYNDGSHVIFLNTKYTDTEGVSKDIVEFLDYIRNDKPKNTYTTELAKNAKAQTEKVRNDPTKEASFMTLRELLYDADKHARQNEREIVLHDVALQMATSMKASPETIASTLKKPIEWVQAVLSMSEYTINP